MIDLADLDLATLPRLRTRRPAPIPKPVADVAGAASRVLRWLAAGDAQLVRAAREALIVELAAESAGAHPPRCRMTRDQERAYKAAEKRYGEVLARIDGEDLRVLCLDLGGKEG